LQDRELQTTAKMAGDVNGSSTTSGAEMDNTPVLKRASVHSEKTMPDISDPVRDLGWNSDPAQIREQMADGVDNDKLWLLLRRFDKVSLYAK
jgi:hypothetical protein